MTRAFCVCVPAHNEARHIGMLIDALAGQSIDRPVPLALCVNNSDDKTAQIAADAAARADGRVELHVLECQFDAPNAHAGSARRVAMDLGAEMLGEDEALLLSTDADCRPPPEWISENLACAGTDHIVGGRIELDEQETVAVAVLALRRRFDHYWEKVRAIEDFLDPLPWDPAPRHGDHTGASLALSVSLYHRAGGVPLLETGEDRGLVEAAVAAGGKLIHPMSVWTRASARVVGRAKGGMSADIQRWLDAVAHDEPPKVPAFDHWHARALWRRRRRVGGAGASLVSAEKALAAMPCDMPLPDLRP